MSEPCGYTQQLSAINAYYTLNYSTVKPINPYVFSIDWNAILEKYDVSQTGRMEFYTNSFPATDIDF